MKNTFDITLVFVTIILCLINHTHFYGLGIGTILTALFIGRIINIYEKKIQLSFKGGNWVVTMLNCWGLVIY